MSTTSRVAIVTGAGTGIGKAVALALLDEGFAVVLAGRREAPLAQTMADAGPGLETRAAFIARSALRIRDVA